MRHLLGALAVLGVLTAGCSGAQSHAADAPSTRDVTDDERGGSIDRESAEQAIFPLTGLPAEDAAAVERPVLALKIDNAPAARPQTGLEDADLVVEEIVEGGTTRFIALYHSTDPGTAGPVRSGREVDAHLLPAFEPILGMSGAAAPVVADLRDAKVTTFEEGQGGDRTFFRSPERSAPHNLYATPAALWKAADTVTPAAQPWPFDAAAPAGGDKARRVDVAFSPAASAGWTWDARAGVWLRHEDGVAHRAASGERLSATNVVLARVEVTEGNRTDAAGYATADIKVIGSGDALVLRDGRVYEARWSKRSPRQQFEWLDAEGDPLPLAPGRTWVELVPTDGQVDRVPPPGTGGDRPSDEAP